MRKLILFLLLAFSTACIILLFFSRQILEKYAEGKVFNHPSEITGTYTALVPGTNPWLRSGYRNPWFSSRIESAAELYKAGKVKKILVSGDNGSKTYNEPEAMRDALVAKGVNENDIVLDYAGFRTFDSVVRAKRIFGQKKILFISQPGQLERGIFIAGGEGIDVRGYAAKSPESPAFRRSYEAREKLASIKCILDRLNPFARPKYLGKPEPF